MKINMIQCSCDKNQRHNQNASFCNSYFDYIQNIEWREAYFNSREGNENFFLSISCSRQERQFLSLNLVLRDANENFFFSISGFETRARIEIETILARIFKELHYFLFVNRIDLYFQKRLLFLEIFWNKCHFLYLQFRD